METTWRVTEVTEKPGIVQATLERVELFKRNPEWEAHADEVGWDGDEFVEAAADDPEAEAIELGGKVTIDVTEGPDVHPLDLVRMTIEVLVHVDA